MSPKNKFPIDIDNRESKKSVVQRFMSSEDALSEDPVKKPESPEQPKSLPQYNFPKPKEIDENEESQENEEDLLLTGRKPIKGEKTPPDSAERTKFNPFVQSKPKTDKKNTKTDSEDTTPNENSLPDIGENFKSLQPSQDLSKPVSKTKDIPVEKIEQVKEIIEEIEEVIEEVIDVVEEIEVSEDEVDSLPETLDTIIEEAEESISSEPEFSLESVLTETQDKIDELLREKPDISDVHSEVTEKIISRSVVRKIIKRAYDYDDKTIAHYIEMLENNDVKSKYYFKNTWESVVVEEVEATLKHVKNMCKCERCFADICAITLNSLDPRYVTTAMGELEDRVAMLDFEKQMKVSTEVFDAIDIVKNNPRHS